MKQTSIIAAAILFAAVLTGCQSVPDSIDEDLSINEYFQKAQEAMVNRGDYETALLYYNTFKERFPQERARIVEADYEIAFIYYKQEQFTKSENVFNDILDRYESADAGIYPQWPKILAEKLLVKIEEKKSLIKDETAPETETQEE